ncbi:unnamed protein product, partial [marine sediment metagenome]
NFIKLMKIEAEMATRRLYETGERGVSKGDFRDSTLLGFDFFSSNYRKLEESLRGRRQ